MAWNELTKKEKDELITDWWTLAIVGAFGIVIVIVLLAFGVIDFPFSFGR